MIFIKIISFFIFYLFSQTNGEIQTSVCPSGTTVSPTDSSVCYLFVKNATWFSDAEYDCNLQGGHLSTVTDGFANNFLAHMGGSVFSSSIDFWIGANNLKPYSGAGGCGINPWLWTKDKSIVDFSSWGVNEPSPGGNCASMNIQGAFWSANNCNGNKPYVCQIPATIGFCQEGWAYNEHTGFCYRFMAVSAGSRTAEEHCVESNAHLVSIHDETENDFVGTLASMNLQTVEDKSGVWIGLVNDDVASHWMWTDGTPVDYTNWVSHGTSGTVNTGAAMYPDLVTNCESNACHLHWTDSRQPTANLRGFICKKASNRAIPSV